MGSRARKAFDENIEDVERLLKIHGEIGGEEKGRRYGLEVLNKSGIVLITAIWEAYCEDLAAEALEHLVTNVSSAAHLPKELKKKIVSDIKSDKNELAMWDLADTGWQARVRARLASLNVERSWNLNTPKADQIDKLFDAALGLQSVSGAWCWKKMSVTTAKQKLDDLVTLRGAIAHRGSSSRSVSKVQVKDYLNHVKQLVAKTGGRVNTFVKQATGNPLW